MSRPSKPFRSDFGWQCFYTPTIMDGPVIRWRKAHMEISASRNAVFLRAEFNIVNNDECRLFTTALSVHKQLAVTVGMMNQRHPESLIFSDDQRMTWSEVTGEVTT